MDDGSHRLLELQELDLSIDRLETRLRELTGQEDLRQARVGMADAEARLGTLRLELDTVSREQRKLEGDIDSMERKIQSERARMLDGSVVNAKEQMERWEGLQGRLAGLEAEEAESRQRVAEIEEGSARELVEVERSLVERRAAREALVPVFDPELLQLYEDIRRQKKGVGAAALENGVCQACHQKLSAMYLDRLKRSAAPRRCEYCRRILVFD